MKAWLIGVIVVVVVTVLAGAGILLYLYVFKSSPTHVDHITNSTTPAQNVSVGDSLNGHLVKVGDSVINHHPTTGEVTHAVINKNSNTVKPVPDHHSTDQGPHAGTSYRTGNAIPWKTIKGNTFDYEVTSNSGIRLTITPGMADCSSDNVSSIDYKECHQGYVSFTWYTSQNQGDQVPQSRPEIDFTNYRFTQDGNTISFEQVGSPQWNVKYQTANNTVVTVGSITLEPKNVVATHTMQASMGFPTNNNYARVQPYYFNNDKNKLVLRDGMSSVNENMSYAYFQTYNSIVQILFEPATT